MMRIVQEIKLAISPKKGPSVKYIIANIQIRLCSCVLLITLYIILGVYRVFVRTEKLLAKLIESTVLSESSLFMHAVGCFTQ